MYECTVTDYGCSVFVITVTNRVNELLVCSSLMPSLYLLTHLLLNVSNIRIYIRPVVQLPYVIGHTVSLHLFPELN